MKYGKPIRKSFLASPFILIGAVIILFFLANATWNISSRLDLSEKKRLQAEAEMNRLVDHQDRLAAEVAFLSTEQGLQSELRTKYRAIKEGESVAVIVDSEQPAEIIQPTTTTDTSPAEKKGWWSNLLHFLGL